MKGRSVRAHGLVALGGLIAASGATMCAPSSSAPDSPPSEAGMSPPSDAGMVDAPSCLATSSRRVAAAYGAQPPEFVIALGPERIYAAKNRSYTQGGSGGFSTTYGSVVAYDRATGRAELVGETSGAVLSGTEHSGSVYWLSVSGFLYTGPAWPGKTSVSTLGLRWSDGAGSTRGAELGAARYPCRGSRPLVTDAGVYVALEVTSVPEDAGTDELGSRIVLVGGDGGVQTLFHASESWTTCSFSGDALYYASGGALRRHGLLDGADTLLADHLDVSSLTVGDSYVAVSSAGDGGSVLVFDKATGALLRTIDARAVGDITAVGSLLYWWRLETSAMLTDAKRTLMAGRADGSCMAPIGSFAQSSTGASDGTGFAFATSADFFEVTAR